MGQYELEQFMAVRNYVDLSFSPDGEWVTYATNASGQFNVWKQPVKAPVEDRPLMPIQLTALVENAARRAAWSPTGGRIVTMADRHGTENHQIYEIPPDSGWLYPLTNKPDVRHELAARPFSPDGRIIVYSSNERQRQDMDLIAHDLESGETQAMLAGDANYFGALWSPDGRHLLAIKVNSNVDQDLYLIDYESGESRHLTPHEGMVRFRPVAWHPTDDGFYLLSNQGRDFVGLAFFDVDKDELAWEQTPRWDVTDADVSADGRYLAWVVNEDGYSRLYVEDGQTGLVHDYPALPDGVVSGLHFSPAAPLLGCYVSQPRRPAELYILNVENGEDRRLTQAFLGGVPQSEMVSPTLIRYSSHDDRDIPAFLYKPPDVETGRRVPVVLSIHGGPESQELPGYNYNGFYQYLLNRGIGILAPNIRGSTGYGKAYQKLIHRDWGGDELQDLECAAKYLQEQEWVDADRIGVFGGSFGGFATLSCVTRLPNYWAAAVDIVGPSNLITFVRSVPPFWRRYMTDLVGDPEEDQELLVERSPITHVDAVKTPLLVIQGANDPRVVKAESDQMVERLRDLGQEVEYLVFEDEGHGFTKTSNYLRALRASAEWLEEHLLLQ